MTPTARRTWRPLLGGLLAERARAAIEDIAAALSRSGPSEDPTLARGDAGRAVFFAYLADVWPGRGFEDRAQAFLDRAIEAVAERLLDDSLYGGFCGVAWAGEHILGRFLDRDEEDPGQAIDDALFALAGTAPWDGAFDLVSGLAGHAVYALERLPRPGAAACLARIVDRLAELAIERPEGVAWRSGPAQIAPALRAEQPDGHYNLGTAHGAPAVALVLAGASAAGVGGNRARRLLDGAVRWILASRLPEGSASRLPPWIVDGHAPAPARSAWCYGDPGAALALYAAARALGEPEWEQAALAMARHAAARPMTTCGVLDAGLCHGASGLAVLYHRLAVASGEEAFADAALRWYRRTLDLRGEGDVAGFRAWRPGPEPPGGLDDRSLLEGVGGIGLALLAGISDVEPAWDRFLAASLPPGSP